MLQNMEGSISGLLAHPSVSKGIKGALQKPGGARYYRCALQVNPFAYLKRHAKQTSFADEDDYNAAMVQACQANGVDVIAITDHFRVDTAESLANAARAAGIRVFTGFEANTSDGVHLLCLFPETTSLADIGLVIGACGVTGFNSESPQADKNCEQLLALIRERGGVTIAAHACSASGLLRTLSGTSRVRTWLSRDLMAVALPGSRADAPTEFRKILSNKDGAHKRIRPVAVINASDVSDPASFATPAATTFVKMSEVSVEGLRQAFLDWESRICLNTDDTPDDHVELIAVAWDGGLLDGQSMQLNKNLNVLIGGRGAGKSTVIESLRHVFACMPKGAEANRSYDSFVKNVLRNGTKISVLIRSPKPSTQYYLLECVVPNRTTIRNGAGALVDGLVPLDIMPGLECYGQHEISELTRSPEKLAHLLSRFVAKDTSRDAEKSDLTHKLGKSRSDIERLNTDLRKYEDDISSLPALREKLDRYDKAGLKNRLADKTILDRELRAFAAARQEVESLTKCIQSTVENSAVSHAAFSEEELGSFPRVELLREADQALVELENKIGSALFSITKAIQEAGPQFDDIERRWHEATATVTQDYESTLRDLQKQGVDGSDFISTQNQVAELEVKEEHLTKLRARKAEKIRDRREFVAAWENVKAQEFRALEAAAKKVGRKLQGRVRVRVRRGEALTPLEAVLRKSVSGQGPGVAIEKFKEAASLSIPDVAEAIRAGSVALTERYGLTPASAEKIASGGESLSMQVEEVDLPAEAIIELNVSREEGVDNWKQLDDLSTGQKATAVLLLLLLGSDAPLLIDQPEDDLDNRFITDVIVPTMRVEKEKRQFIFSTHNANIPVLGDAEQIVGLTPVVEFGVERTLVPNHLVGSIDTEGVREMVRELLEGGRAAFELRREKYGF
ncbi:TrlF family AAA-like ATPase [Methylobacterium sp. SD21]|uniref:TrlF family AAA-like ATPase n=1 Tax=Methylobacterium litchii TaxID=3138810 RepID=UPI00313EE30C